MDIPAMARAFLLGNVDALKCETSMHCRCTAVAFFCENILKCCWVKPNAFPPCTDSDSKAHTSRVLTPKRIIIFQFRLV
eukprot:19705_5